MEAKEIVKQAYLKQSLLVERLKLAIETQQLSHAFLFVGSKNQGQEYVATWLAMYLMCENPYNGNPDLICSNCRRIASHDYPDVIEIQPDGQSIKIDQIRYLQSEFNKKAIEGKQKIFIINFADTMTVNASNSLLKFIEEPVGKQIIILIAENRQQVLPTIASRTQVINFYEIDQVSYQKELIDFGYSKMQIKLVMALTSSLDVAKELLINDWFNYSYKVILELVEDILNLDPQTFNKVQIKVMPFAQDKFKQLILLNMFSVAWRDLILLLDDPLNETFIMEVKKCLPIAKKFGIDKLLKVHEFCLESLKWLNSNISFQTVVEVIILKSQFSLSK